MDFFARFLIGGLVVSLFAVLGDVLKPKTFAGLFAAAPSVALASLGLAYAKEGPQYVSLEGRSMIAGALGMVAYGLTVRWLTEDRKWPALGAALTSLALWTVISFCVLIFVLRGAA